MPAIDGVPRIDVASLSALARTARTSGRAAERDEAEAATHGAGWLRFWIWCESNGFSGDTLPATGAALAGWLAWAIEELDDIAIVATLQAIRDRHVAAGFAAQLEALGA